MLFEKSLKECIKLCGIWYIKKNLIVILNLVYNILKGDKYITEYVKDNSDSLIILLYK